MPDVVEFPATTTENAPSAPKEEKRPYRARPPLRPKVLRKCPHCGKEYGTRALVQHEKECRERSQANNTAPATSPSTEIAAEPPASKPAVEISRAVLPMPPAYKCKPVEFFRYWNSLAEGEQARVLVYVYRTWPKMDYTRGLSPEDLDAIARKLKTPPETNIGKLSTPFPVDTWREEILHRWGSGNFHFKLNDTGVRDDPNLKAKRLCMMDTGDVIDEHYPPVLDLEKLDLFADTNQSYLRGLKLKGVRVPGLEKDEQENDDDMATNAALADTVKDLTGEVVKLATQAHARPQPVDAHSQAQLKTGEIIAEASKEAIKIVTDAHRRDADAQDPNKYLQNVLAVAERIAPKSSDNGSLHLIIEQMRADREDERERARQEREDARERAREERLREREFHQQQLEMMRQMNDAQIKSLEARVTAAETRAANPATTAAPATGTAANDQFSMFARALDSVLKLKDKLSAAAEPSDRPWWAELIQPASDAVTSVARAVETGMYNRAVAATGNGTPVAPATATIEAEGEDPDMNLNPYAMFWNQVKPQLAKALQDGVPGHVFGAQLAITHGGPAYDQLRGLGEGGIYQFINGQDPQFWQWTRGFAQRFGEFVQEFLDLEQVKQAIQELQIARENAAAPPEPEPIRTAAPRPAPPQPKAPNQPGLPQAVVDARRTQG